MRRFVGRLVAGSSNDLFLFQGELTFTESQDGQLSIGGPVRQCTAALGVSEQALLGAMAGRVLSAGGDLVNKEHSLTDANYTRLALAKAAYDRLFTWIVQQVLNILPAVNRRPAQTVHGGAGRVRASVTRRYDA